MTVVADSSPVTPEQRTQMRRAVVSSSVGAALEWFDLVVYGSFAVVIAANFFPNGDGGLGIILVFATFAISYLIRPLGALLIGAYGDHFGRKKALTFTLLFMTVGTLIMAIAPTYSMVGAWAGVILLLSRIIQGFSAGGEFGSASTYLIEMAPHRKAYYASWQVASQGIAMFLASAAGYLLFTFLPHDALYSWGWRVPFAIGILIGPTGLYIRSRLSETTAFVNAEKRESPIRSTVTTHLGAVFTGAACIGAASISIYMMLYMPTFAATNLHTSASAAYLGGVIAGLVMAIGSPLIGAVCDRIGTTPVMLWSAVAALVLAWPIFAIVVAAPAFVTVVLVVTVLGIIATIYFAPLPTLLASLFPVNVRATGVSLAYNIGATVLGGLTPLALAWLLQATGILQIPSIYYGAVAVLSVAGVLIARRHYGVR